MPARPRLWFGTLALLAARPAAAQQPPESPLPPARVTTPAYALYAPTDSIAALARPDLDSAAAFVTRSFGPVTKPIAVVVFPSAAELRAFDWAPLRARGYQPLPWLVLPGGDVRQAGGGLEGVRALGHEACHTFVVARYPRPAGAPRTPVYGAAAVPDWVDEAMAVRCEPAAQRTERLARWRERRHADSAAVLPLAELFRAEHPLFGAVSAMIARERLAGSADTARAGGATVRTLRLPTGSPVAALFGVDPERALAFYAQSLSVAEFLEAREGPGFLGRLADALAAGATMDAALAAVARVVPRDVAGLERAWRAWLGA